MLPTTYTERERQSILLLELFNLVPLGQSKEERVIRREWHKSYHIIACTFFKTIKYLQIL